MMHICLQYMYVLKVVGRYIFVLYNIYKRKIKYIVGKNRYSIQTR